MCEREMFYSMFSFRNFTRFFKSLSEDESVFGVSITHLMKETRCTGTYTSNLLLKRAEQGIYNGDRDHNMV